MDCEEVGIFENDVSKEDQDTKLDCDDMMQDKLKIGVPSEKEEIQDENIAEENKTLKKCENLTTDDNSKQPCEVIEAKIKKKVAPKKPVKPVRSLTQEEYDEIFNSALLCLEENDELIQATSVSCPLEAPEAQSSAFNDLASAEIEKFCSQQNTLDAKGDEPECVINKSTSIEENATLDGDSEKAAIDSETSSSQTAAGKGEENVGQEVNTELDKNTNGLWVQCVRLCCMKWRFLSDVDDPAEVPEEWICEMHPAEAYNSCEKPEESWDEQNDKLDFIYTAFTGGSLVWAKMTGYPWWPAMVQDDPESGTFFECTGQKNVANSYHVVYLDETISRAWTNACNLKPFKKEMCIKGTSSASQRKKVAFGRVLAMKAQEMAIERRLQEFDFETLLSEKGKMKTVANKSSSGGTTKKIVPVSCVIEEEKSSEIEDSEERTPKKKKVLQKPRKESKKNKEPSSKRKPSFVGPADKKRKIEKPQIVQDGSKKDQVKEDNDQKESASSMKEEKTSDKSVKKLNKKQTPKKVMKKENENKPKTKSTAKKSKEDTEKGTPKIKRDVQKPSFVGPSAKKKKEEDDILKETDELLNVTDEMLSEYFGNQEFHRDDETDVEMKEEKTEEPVEVKGVTSAPTKKRTPKKSASKKDSTMQEGSTNKKPAKPSFGPPKKNITECADQQVPQNSVDPKDIIGTLQAMDVIATTKKTQPKKGFVAPVAKKSPTIPEEDERREEEVVKAVSPLQMITEDDSQSLELDLDMSFATHEVPACTGYDSDLFEE